MAILERPALVKSLEVMIPLRSVNTSSAGASGFAPSEGSVTAVVMLDEVAHAISSDFVERTKSSTSLRNFAREL
jgi:hypothetical protein